MICRYSLIKKEKNTRLLVNLIRNFKFGATQNFKSLEFTFYDITFEELVHIKTHSFWSSSYIRSSGHKINQSYIVYEKSMIWTKFMILIQISDVKIWKYKRKKNCDIFKKVYEILSYWMIHEILHF